MKKLKLLAVLSVIVCLLSACGGGKSALVGRWEAVDKGVKVAYGFEHSYLDELEFFSDGTYNSDLYSGDYSVDGNRLKLSAIISSAYSFTFDVSGGTLTMYDDDGNSYEYKKVG